MSRPALTLKSAYDQEVFAKVKLLILDVDGVLTDGRIILNDQGEETKHFNVKDGHGLRMLMQAGIEVALISGRNSRAAEFRAGDLGISEVHLGVRNKAGVCAGLIQSKGLAKAEVCCMGDDLPDLPLFERSGITVAVADAMNPRGADFSTRTGRKGRVRELCEVILRTRVCGPHSSGKNYNAGMYRKG
jgi:3-deoxy-D-manno-octulosonate 8-phosphate phosphatase (KDO 8-P phosphatase)